MNVEPISHNLVRVTGLSDLKVRLPNFLWNHIVIVMTLFEKSKNFKFDLIKWPLFLPHSSLMFLRKWVGQMGALRSTVRYNACRLQSQLSYLADVHYLILSKVFKQLFLGCCFVWLRYIH